MDVIRLTPNILDEIGLPPLSSLGLKVALNGRVETTNGTIQLQWIDHVHREVRPARTGIILQWGDERRRLSLPLFSLVEAAEAYNLTRGRPFEQRVASWMSIQTSLQSLGRSVSTEGYLSSFTIYEAGSFALDVHET
jgi:hypothetical protein